MTKPGAPRNTAAETAASKRWRERHPERARAGWRTRWARSQRFARHGITAEWFRDQLVGQAGRCAICTNVLTPGRATHIDHDHATGHVRGLLCNGCNLMLGNAQDSVRLLEAAIRYLSVSYGGNPRSTFEREDYIR